MIDSRPKPQLSRGLPVARLAWTLTVLFLLLPAVAVAATYGRDKGKNVVGFYGVGWSSADAPIGLRYLFDPRNGFDLGFGFRSDDTPGGRESEVVLEGAYLLALAPGERTNVFLRPGIRFANLSIRGDSSTRIGIDIAVDVEHFLADRVSVSARSGFRYDSLSAPDRSSDRDTFRTIGDLLLEGGVHLYLGPDRRPRSP